MNGCRIDRFALARCRYCRHYPDQFRSCVIYYTRNMYNCTVCTDKMFRSKLLAMWNHRVFKLTADISMFDSIQAFGPELICWSWMNGWLVERRTHFIWTYEAVRTQVTDYRYILSSIVVNLAEILWAFCLFLPFPFPCNFFHKNVTDLGAL